jgi:hypothetical protein
MPSQNWEERVKSPLIGFLLCPLGQHWQQTGQQMLQLEKGVQIPEKGVMVRNYIRPPHLTKYPQNDQTMHQLLFNHTIFLAQKKITPYFRLRTKTS